MQTQVTSNQFQKLRLLRLLLCSSALRRESNSTKGFTLTEVLVVAIMAAVLAAIAAPSWLAFGNRQRVSTANAEMLQMLREAQTDAISKRTTYGIELARGDGPNELGPTVTKFTEKQGQVGRVFQTERLGNDDGDTDSGLTLTTVPANEDRFTFGFDGQYTGPLAAIGSDYVSKLVLEKDGVTRCVIVETLLGAMSEGKDDECDA